MFPRPIQTMSPAAQRLYRIALPVMLVLWLLPLLSILLGAFLRFWHLGQPQDIAFDETYYVKDSWAIMLSGYEREWPDDADAGFAAGLGEADILLTWVSEVDRRL